MREDAESFLGIEPNANAEPEIAGDIVESSIWSFDGRIGRASFWTRQLLLTLVGVGVNILVTLLSDALPPLAIVAGILWLVVAVWISLAIQVKRWHDLDKSGWFVLLNFTLIALPVVIIILGCVRGTSGPNGFGADPLASSTFADLTEEPPASDAQQ